MEAASLVLLGLLLGPLPLPGARRLRVLHHWQGRSQHQAFGSLDFGCTQANQRELRRYRVYLEGILSRFKP